MIRAEIVADSKNEFGERITSMVCTFPRFILAELNTHRMFSRNSASSRAIPYPKMVKLVKDNPFIPVAWQKDHKGMQGFEYLDSTTVEYVVKQWLFARDCMIDASQRIASNDVTKQLCNRLLEPFMWHTALVTSTEWENFFHLRTPQYIFNDKIFKSRQDWLDYNFHEASDNHEKNYIIPSSDIDWLTINKGAAEIHMMMLAEAIYTSLKNSTPTQLSAGEWHIPFGERIYSNKLAKAVLKMNGNPMNIPITDNLELGYETEVAGKIQVATARCARVSYINYEGKDDYEADIDLYGSLLKRPYKSLKGIEFSANDPVHASPAEHCAKAMTEEEYFSHVRTEKFPLITGSGAGEDKIVLRELYPLTFQKDQYKDMFGWCRNFKGFVQHRAFIEGQNSLS